MSDAVFTPRGIEVARVATLAIWAGRGFVSVCTRRLPEPLGREAWLHAVRLLVGAGLKLWPDAVDDVGKSLTDALDDARSSQRAGA